MEKTEVVLEEKLYFKPTDYGKGGKDKRPRRTADGEEKKEHRAARLIFLLGFLALAILIIVWLLKGKMMSTNEKIPNVKNTALSCSSDSFVYPLFRYDNAESRNLEVKMIFSEDELKSISLEYTLFYNSAEAIKASEAHNHAEMNFNFGRSGLNPDHYDAKYTILSDSMRMNLYSVANRLDEAAKPYFLINGDGTFPTRKTELKKNYEAKGFSCKTTE